uniref:Cytochrome P450 family protein n=1 Tax=Populus alba TaxID=43335 RepID=A0A4U5NQD8_POPAL|nr:cytochrome P450 family protein [Populus alba]
MDDAYVAMLSRHILPGRCRKLLMWLQIGSEKRLSVAKGTIRQIVTNYMATKREELSAGAKTKEDEETFDVLRSFLTINDVDDKEHPDEIVRDITIGYAIRRMARVWGQDCHEFKPERWINEKGDLKYERPVKFFTFNAGPGKEMAFSIMEAAAATILYNYHVQVVETRPVTPKSSIILEMKHG